MEFGKGKSELKFYRRRRRLTKKQKIRYAIRAGIALAVIILAIMVTIAFGKRVKVSDSSMNPTLENAQTVCIDRLRYKIFKPKKGDIIAFAPQGSERSVVQVKRVVGTPGDKIQIKKGKLYINGEVQKDEFSAEDIKNAGICETELTVEDDHYFVLGDDRNNSEDSRYDTVGNVSSADIIGKVWIRVSPIFALGFYF